MHRKEIWEKTYMILCELFKLKGELSHIRSKIAYIIKSPINAKGHVMVTQQHKRVLVPMVIRFEPTRSTLHLSMYPSTVVKKKINPSVGNENSSDFYFATCNLWYVCNILLVSIPFISYVMNWDRSQ